MLKQCDLDPILDAVIAAPAFHKILLDNAHVRILDVVVSPGVRETFHTHVWQSIFLPFSSPTLNYFIPEQSEPLFTIPARSELAVLHLGPEGLHALENLDRHDLHAIRIELKQAPKVEPREVGVGPQIETGVPGRNLCLDNSIVRVCLADKFQPCGSPAIIVPPFTAAATVEWIDTAASISRLPDDAIVVSLKYLSF